MAIVIAGFFLVSGKPKKNITAVPSGSVQNVVGSPDPVANVKEFTVIGTEYAFTPSTVEVNTVDTVKITFQNSGTSPHNLVIKSLNVSTKVINPGESDSIEFIATKSGNLDYVCTIFGHKDKGMEGILTVQ